MKLTIAGGESFTLTSQTIDKLIRAGDGDAALMYLYMLRTHGQSTDEQAAETLGKGKGWVASATALLSRMGLIEIDTGETAEETTQAAAPAAESTQNTGPLREPRQYTREHIIGEINSGSKFKTVVDETERRLSKKLSPDDLERLYGIYDDLRLPPEVILLLITHCISECRVRGDGRTPTLRYIEKAAFAWEREGIFTLEQAEEHLRTIEAQRTARGKIKQILQVKNREFSPTETRYVDGWIKMGFDPEVIEQAYDITVVNTGSLAYPYMDTILKKWDAKGLHTAEQVQSENKPPKSTGGYNARAGKNSDAARHGGPTVEEIERMKRLRKKTQE